MTTVSEVTDENWVVSEFQDVDFNDVRLNNRLHKVATQLLLAPNAPINQSAVSWADTKGAYRFFGNPKISIEGILLPHVEHTEYRIKEAGFSLAIQDTTSFNFSKHKSTNGLGNIGVAHNSEIMGLMAHTTISLSTEGIPLGIIHQKIWNRKGKTGDHLIRPILEKESWKWIEALRATKDVEELSGTKIVTVADRESDIYEFIFEAEELDSLYVIRASTDRILFGDSRSESPKISDYFEASAAKGNYDVEVPRNRDIQNKRIANLEIKFEEICIRPPYQREGAKTQELPPLIVSVIKAVETNPPKGEEPIEWTLITNCKVTTLNEAVEKIRWYSYRWHIEVYHKIIKSGFKVEECRLNSGEKLKKILTLCSILAWRVDLLTYFSRAKPETPCSEILSESEWKSLYVYTTKKKSLPKKVPSIKDATLWIAKLGGYLNRKSDPPPGITVIWRGLSRLSDISKTWELLN